MQIVQMMQVDRLFLADISQMDLVKFAYSDRKHDPFTPNGGLVKEILLFQEI